MTSGALAIRRLVISGIASLVILAGCGGGSNQSMNNQSPNPTPTITSVSPNGAVVGGAFTLTINGTNFVAASMVTFGGSAPATTFVNSTELTAAIPAASVVSTGTLAVTVTNPAPGGGVSNSVNFNIAISLNPVPTIRYFIPSCVPAGEQFVDSVDNQLEVIGTNFVANSVVRWNGTDRPTTPSEFGGGGILDAQISASDIAAAGTATVTVFNPGPGGGTSNSMTFTITPGAVGPLSIAVDPTGKFAYVADAGCSVVGYLSMYTINPTTGALTSTGLPLTAQDDFTDSVTVDPFGKFAYVVNNGDDISSGGSVVTYSINATTGALTFTGALRGACEVDGLCHAVSMVVHPSGKFAYVTYGPFYSQIVAMYSIDATTGALTSIGTIAVEGYASSVAVDPMGKFAYVTTGLNYDGTGIDSVSMYTIDATTGVLTSTGAIATETNPNPVSVTVDPSGKFAYVTNSGSNDVSMYTINATTGALASIGTIAAGTNPVSVAVDPTGKFAYVANADSNDVSMYTIDGTTGALTPIGMIAAGLSSPTSIAVHPSGKFVYVTNSGTNDVSMYSIDPATGELTLIGTIGT